MSSLSKKNSVMDHFKNNFRDRIIPDYRTQMTKWGNANKEIMVLAVEAQANWRKTLEAARLRKKAEDERDKMILSLVLGIGTGVAFGFISTAVQAKIGHRFKGLVEEDVLIETSDMFDSARISKIGYNGKLGQLVGGAIEQFEDKGGLDVAHEVAFGDPDYFSALSHMHNDFVTIERLRTDLEQAWATTANKGEAYLHFLINRASEEWCDRMFLRPARGNVSKAKAHVEDFLVRLSNLLRTRTQLWGNDPKIHKDMRDEIEREIWAVWAITKKRRLHAQPTRSSGTGISVYPPRPGDPWRPLPNIGRPYADHVRKDPKNVLMFKAEEAVTDRLALLGVVQPQDEKQRATLKERGMAAGTLAIRDDIDTPAEYKALFNWGKTYLKGKKRIAPKARAVPRAPVTSLTQLNAHARR